MNRVTSIILILAGFFLTQCRAYREVVEPEAPKLVGLVGLKETCIPYDTVHSVIIHKAESLIVTDEDRYEATVTIYAVKDSLIYMSAVNSGFEILRAAVKPDSIWVIDRLNKIVYQTPVIKRFGYQQPVNFEDVQNIIHGLFVCDDLHLAGESDFYHIEFDFDEPLIKKRISINRETLQMDKFEFFHTQTQKYLMGEREEAGFKIFTNFMITEFEIRASGGTITYNQALPVKMSVNKRKYTFIEL